MSARPTTQILRLLDEAKQSLGEARFLADLGHVLPNHEREALKEAQRLISGVRLQSLPGMFDPACGSGPLS